MQLKIPFESQASDHTGTPTIDRMDNNKINRLDPADHAFHDWYRFNLSFPPHLVRKYINDFDLNEEKTVLDPFCGTGTTVLESKLNRITAMGIEASPFARLASAVKIDWQIDPEVLLTQATEVARRTDMQLAQAFVKNLGIGVVLGAGVGFFASYILPRIKKILGPMSHSRSRLSKLTPWIASLALTGLLIAQVPLIAAVIAVLGVWLMVAVAARVTGEINIDPLEQFGIFVALVIALIYKFASLELTNPFRSFLRGYPTRGMASYGELAFYFQAFHSLSSL